MRGAVIGLALVLLAASAPAEAIDLRAAEATVLAAQRYTPFEPAIPEVRRPRRVRLDLPSSEAFGTPAGWPGGLDRLDLIVSLLDGLALDGPLGRLAYTARRVRNLLSPSENIRLSVKIDPLDREYRAVVRVRF